ncbi:MAG TPA: glycosyltransferase [Ktedonobacterales bacterium]|nr:glycosyltransferase [Ktedonobacterales bacterium]
MVKQQHAPARHSATTPYQPTDASYRTAIGRLAVVLPAYDEEAVIADTISDVLAKVPTFVSDFIVIPVDDGSRDRTGEIMDELARSHQSHLSVVHHPTNRGYGSALRSGFDRALSEGANAIFLMDSDGQFDIAELKQFLPLLSQYDAVLGYRLHRSDGPLRKANAWAWSQVIRLSLGVNVSDPDCAFKLFRADFIRAAHLRATGAMISPEMLGQLKRANLRFVEVGVHHYPRTSGTPTGSNIWVILSAFRELILLRDSIVHGPPLVLPNTRPDDTDNTDNTDNADGDLANEKTRNTWRALLKRVQPHHVALAAIMAMAVALRGFNLGGTSLWLDELGEGSAAQLNLGDMFNLVRFHAGATPFDYLGVKAITAALGYGTAATRLWACAVGCLAVLMIYLVGTQIFRSRLIGLLAAILLCCSPYHIAYSQEARFYSLLALMALVNLYFFERAMRRGTWRTWGIFALIVALGLYAHYFLALFLVIEGVYVTLYWLARWVAAGRRKQAFVEGAQQVGRAALAMLAGCALFAPWMIYATTAQLDVSRYRPLGALPFPFFSKCSSFSSAWLHLLSPRRAIRAPNWV